MRKENPEQKAEQQLVRGVQTGDMQTFIEITEVEEDWAYSNNIWEKRGKEQASPVILCHFPHPSELGIMTSDLHMWKSKPMQVSQY